MKLIPCCNFPIKLLLLDDDDEFLKGIQYGISNLYKCISTTDVNKAKRIVKENENWAKRLFRDSLSRSFDSYKFSVEMDITSLHTAIYDPNRFDNIGLLIIDYDMADVNGLDFIRGLGDHNLKIIMLTGKATPDTVFQAFNNGEIQRYVSKGDQNYLQILIKYIKELQQDFFIDFSRSILDSLKTETDIFDNQVFQELFRKIVQENNIEEYYLLDESGSFLLVDGKAENQVWLIFKSKEDMRHFYELAAEDPDTPAYVIKKLKNHEAFTHFKTKEESNMSAKYWHLIDCKPLDKESKFYYAILKNDENFKIDLSMIKSYKSFLNESE